MIIFIQEAQLALDEERKRTAWLYNAFLPRTTATQIAAGQQPEAGKD